MTAPCPFCGAIPHIEQRISYRVCCSCGYFMHSAPSEEVAWKRWDDLVRALEKARSALKPCPFCGCSVSLTIGVYGGSGGGDLFMVVHPENDCILSEVASWSSTLDEVVPAWNSRVKEGGS